MNVWMDLLSMDGYIKGWMNRYVDIWMNVFMD